MSAQALGLVLLALGAWLLWSPWALVIGGALMIVVPEVLAVMRRPKRPVAR